MATCATPLPILAQPAETALARPTTEGENMDDIQYWLATKLPRDKPDMNRRRINPLWDAEAPSKANTTDITAVTSDRTTEARRGPRRSQRGPMTRRATKVADRETTPAVTAVDGLTPSTGRSGGTEKAVKKHVKRDSQAKWKALMCGNVKERGRSSIARFSESTGMLTGSWSIIVFFFDYLLCN